MIFEIQLDWLWPIPRWRQLIQTGSDSPLGIFTRIEATGILRWECFLQLGRRRGKPPFHLRSLLRLHAWELRVGSGKRPIHVFRWSGEFMGEIEVDLWTPPRSLGSGRCVRS